MFWSTERLWDSQEGAYRDSYSVLGPTVLVVTFHSICSWWWISPFFILNPHPLEPTVPSTIYCTRFVCPKFSRKINFISVRFFSFLSPVIDSTVRRYVQTARPDGRTGNNKTLAYMRIILMPSIASLTHRWTITTRTEIALPYTHLQNSFFIMSQCFGYPCTISRVAPSEQEDQLLLASSLMVLCKLHYFSIV